MGLGCFPEAGGLDRNLLRFLGGVGRKLMIVVGLCRAICKNRNGDKGGRDWRGDL